MDKEFQFVQEMVDILSGMQVQLVSNTRQGLESAMQQIFQQLLPAESLENTLLRSLQTLAPDCIYELSSPMDLHFALFSPKDSGKILLIGPCRWENLSQAQLTQRLQPMQLPPERLRALCQFCAEQPVASYEKLHRLAALLAQRLLGRPGPVPFRKLDYRWNAEDRRQIFQAAAFQELDYVRQIEGRYEASAALTEAVKQGNLSLAYRFIHKMGSIPADLSRNPDPIRNAKNLCIILNTQLRHALEESGMSPYRLDQLSGSIARQIEKFNSYSAVEAYFSQIIQMYCTLAQEDPQRGLGPFARLAVTYIQSHLSDNLTVKEAARALLVNPDYLSAQFHREVGVPFITYVNQQRVRQAAALLRQTDLQIQQIASAVGYNNTSYFAKQFLRFQGMTPRAYRKCEPGP